MAVYLSVDARNSRIRRTFLDAADTEHVCARVCRVSRARVLEYREKKITSFVQRLKQIGSASAAMKKKHIYENRQNVSVTSA